MAKKKKRPASSASSASSSSSANPHLREILAQVDALCARKQWAKARAHLNDSIPPGTRDPAVFERLIKVAEALNDGHLLQFACEGLYELRPTDMDLPHMLTRVYILNGLVALALARGLRALVESPTSRLANFTRQKVAELTPLVNMEVARLGLQGPDGVECLALLDQTRAFLDVGRFEEAYQTGMQLLQRRPRFTPAYNNAAEACFHGGKVPTAIDLELRLLNFDPNNLFARGNLVRFLVFSGKMEDARRHAERLKTLTPVALDMAVKQAEALAWLGDDAGVLAVINQAGPLLGTAEPRDDALIHHLAAVAAYRLGQENLARSHWQHALRAVPEYELARHNLNDLTQPPSRRHAPWSYTLSYYVPRQLIDNLVTRLVSTKQGGHDAEARRYLQIHPELEGLVPLLLDRSDKVGRELAMHLVRLLRTPATLRAARDFALGQRGPDEMRMEALQLAQQAGLLQPGATRIWLEGQWRDGIPVGYDIHTQPLKRNHAPGIAELLASGIEAFQAGNYTSAEEIYRRALLIDPNDVVVLNNLATVCTSLGRTAEGEELSLRLHKLDPDYLFGRTALASFAAERGQFARARELLEPLLTRSRFHTDEITALCIAEMNLYLASGDLEKAKKWLEMLRSANPTHPAIRSYAARMRC